jgi:hypothetical protein
MPYPQARMLIENPSFAHMWLCHSDDHTCPDGCDCGADPKRAEMYSNIRCYYTDQDVRAYRRGYEMAAKGKAPIFRKVGDRIESELDSDMSADWDDDMRQAYLDGYNAAI